ncbi:A disintegrin and metalloproteinase with thrombospondin motifs 12-like [Hypanus sabinus]|uniref:A disintegrin and metalloproteinase with thrombospondin motifs 12-like n=1 Tax=Hypanus sabinus TaxID=79690 RepID=UPI0028C43170|nr:A disintegrin and metalloproteinase with thrombospondin motifs 12-like [Hypanus sabinus]
MIRAGERFILSILFTFKLLGFPATSHGSVPPDSLHFAGEKQEKFIKTLQSYEIVHPVKVDESGTFLSQDVSHYVNHVRRRDLRKQGDHVFYQIVLRGQKLFFNLTVNQPFLSPAYVLEKRYGNVTGAVIHGPAVNTCHFTGRVQHPKLGSGAAAVSTCKGLHGFFRLHSEDYFIEPIRSHPQRSEKQQPHIIYKRQVSPHSQRKQHGLPSGSSGSCGIRDSFNNILKPERLRERWEGIHRKGRRISQRSISKERWVETLVVADTEMIEYHGSENVQSYIFTIINMVASLFHDPSIGNAIHIVLVRLILLEEEEKELKIIHHADHTLSSFCKWQKNINPKSDSSPNHHDVAVLLTRKDLCAGMNHPCETLGLSHVSGMCQPHRSCNINEDSGLPVAFTIAHEIGHSFGIQHDGQGNDCEPMDTHHFIMSRQLQYDQSPLIWSPCSKDYITRFLDRGWGFCLNDRPTKPELMVPTIAPGVLYDVHHQCQLQYGPNSTFCEEMDNICQTLWCSVNGTCRSKLDAAADGTSCGEKKWCFNSECVAVGNRPEAVDGGWGSWSSWSHCTRSCGAGVQAAERPCSNPVPKFGGKYCTGKRKRYRICNVTPCQHETPTFRQMQCSEFDTVLYKNELYTWIPVLNPANSCELHCRPVDQQFSEKMLDTVIDGTSCTEAVNSRDICINGICKTVGCDYEIESNAVEDQCGVCHGNGSSCQTVKKTFEESEGLGYVDVALIPEGARDIRVEEIAEAGNFLALRSEDPEKYFLNGGFIIQWNGDYSAAGTIFKYERNGNLENLTAPGPTKEPVWIQLLFQETNPGIRYEYTIKKHTEEENTISQPEFFWKYGAWTACSAPCGQGVQRQIVRCVEKTPRVVEDRFCNPRTRPDDRQRKCNKMDCPARWWTGEWQECSASCGNTGIKKRTVLCTRTVGTEEQALPNSECKQLLKPRTQMPCNRDISCPSNWTVGNWSECSTTCGGGFRTRTVICTLTNKELCDISKRPNTKGLCGLRSCPVNKKNLLPPWKPEGGKIFHKVFPNKLWPKYGPNHSDGKVQPNHKQMLFTTKQPLLINITMQPPIDTDPATSASTTTGNQKNLENKLKPNGENSTVLYNEHYDNDSNPSHQNLTRKGNTNIGRRFPEPGKITHTTQTVNATQNTTDETFVISTDGQVTIEKITYLPSFTEDPKLSLVTDGSDDTIAKTPTAPVYGDKSTLFSTTQESLMTTVTPSRAEAVKPNATAPSSGFDHRKINFSKFKVDPQIKATINRLKLKLLKMLNANHFSSATDNPALPGEDRLQVTFELTTSNVVGTTPSSWVNLSKPFGNTFQFSKAESTTAAPLKNIVPATIATNVTIDNDDFENLTRTDIVFWKVGNWSECSTTCGVGAVWRQVECSTNEESDCEQTKKPVPARRCFVRPCAMWKIGNWSKCSENCGGGIKTRELQCLDARDKRLLRPFHCQLLGPKPITSLDCNVKACSEWNVSAWSECSKTCGTGIQERSVYCAEHKQCHLKAQPQSSSACNIQPCTEWVAGTWSKCSASCGGGSQRRTVKCVNMETSETEEDNSTCELKPPPRAVQVCNQQKCGNKKGNTCTKDRMSEKFCLTLKKLGRCYMMAIKIQCCRTCLKFNATVRRKGIAQGPSQGASLGS